MHNSPSIKRIAILFSGNGSNLEALIQALHGKFFQPQDSTLKQEVPYLIGGIKAFKEVQKTETNGFGVEVVLALSNKQEAYGLKRAQNLGIPTKILESKGKEREEFDRELVEILKPLKLDLCVLAGFMRILTPIFTQQIQAINIHPSLLPLFKGANGMADSWKSPMKIGGVSVHFVSDELDSGEIIAQGAIEKLENESLESYTKRIHALEHTIYPQAVLKTLMQG